MSTGRTLIGIGILALIGISLTKKKSTSALSISDKRKKVKDWVLSVLTVGEKVDMTIFDKMSDQELQLIIDVLIDKKYSMPLQGNVLLQFNQLSEKYNIFT